MLGLGALAITLMLSTAAIAAPGSTIIKRAGNWEAFSTSAKICGMSYYWQDQSFFMIKMPPDQTRTIIHLHKPTWSLAYGQSIPINIGFDNGTPTSGTAIAEHIADTGSTVNNHLFSNITDGDVAVAFMKNFISARLLKVTFPEGDEPMWTLDLTGSAEVGAAFANCMKSTQATQPSTRPTQPGGKQPQIQTQPGGKRPASPTTPVIQRPLRPGANEI